MDDDAPYDITEETVSTQSMQELEARLETTLRNIKDTDTEIGLHEVGSREAGSLLQLRQANTALAIELTGCIEFKIKRIALCESALNDEELHEASIDLAAAQSEMGVLGGRSMKLRLVAAEKRFWDAFDRSCKHRSKRPS